MLTHPHILIDLAISWLEDRGYRVYAGIVFEYYRRTQGLKELDRDMIIFLLGVERHCETPNVCFFQTWGCWQQSHLAICAGSPSRAEW